MNGWMQARRNGPFHQVEHVTGGNLKGYVRLMCEPTNLPEDIFPILDYRAWPSPRCKRPACQREVEA